MARKDYLRLFYQENGLNLADIPDHQIILVGSNPLPVYIALHILEPKTAILIGSFGQSIEVARQIKEVVEAEGLETEVRIEGLNDPNDYQNIEDLITKLVKTSDENKRIDFQKTGINYTGGTKMMSVHFYRLLESKGRIKSVPHLASYVSPKHQLMLDGFSHGIALYGQFNLSIDHLLKMHHMEFKNQSATQKVHISDSMIRLSKAIFADVKDQYKEDFSYEKMCNDLIFKRIGHDISKDDKSDLIHQYLQLEIKPEWYHLQAELRRATGNDGQKCLLVRDLANYFAELEGKSPNIYNKKSNKQRDLFEDFYVWWSAKWQEYIVYDLLARGQTDHQLGINEASDEQGGTQLFNSLEAIYSTDREKMNLDASFELDIVFLRSHIPHVISCTTDETIHIVKGKLFEAQSRTRIIGGDHAKFALLSFINKKNKDNLTYTLKRLWSDFENYKVFGVDDFFADNFEEVLMDWATNY